MSKCSCCPCGTFDVQQIEPAVDEKYIMNENSGELRQVSNTMRYAINQSVQLESPTETFRRHFHGAAGDDSEIDAYQLREVLNGTFREDLNFRFEGFSLDTCRSMVALGDPDLSGRLHYQEASVLFEELWKWKTGFLRFDHDRNGFFFVREFKRLLEAIGYNLNHKSVHALCVRYSDRQGRVHFGDFVACMFKLTAMYETFRDKCSDMQTASFCTDEFIQLTVYS